MVNVFNDDAKYNFNGKEYSGAELNEVMTKAQNNNYRFDSVEERELYSFCWGMFR